MCTAGSKDTLLGVAYLPWPETGSDSKERVVTLKLDCEESSEQRAPREQREQSDHSAGSTLTLKFSIESDVCQKQMAAKRKKSKA